MGQTNEDILQGRGNRGFKPMTQSGSIPPKRAINPNTPARGFTPQKLAASSGLVRGPGTGTSDEVPDKVPQGTYILPADTTQKMGMGEGQGEELGEAADGIPVNLSNGEFKLSPEQVHAIGVGVLNQVKNATHTPVARGFVPKDQRPAPAPSSFADGGPVARGFKPRSFADGGPVKRLYLADAGIVTKNRLDEEGITPNQATSSLGSSGQFAKVPQGVIGEQPAKMQDAAAPTSSVAGAPGVARVGNSYQAAPAQPAPSRGFLAGAFPNTSDAMKGAGQSLSDSYKSGGIGAWAGEAARATAAMPVALAHDLNNSARTITDPIAQGAKTFFTGDATPIDQPQSASPVPVKTADQPALKTNNSVAASQAEAETWGQQAQTTDSLKQRLASTGRDGMTNAEVGQANPNGVVTMKRQANGTMEFSGNNVKGPVSYADDQGQAIAGAGMRSKGFGRVDVAPAGANVVMGPNGSYAFSNDPTPSGGQQASQPRGDRGFSGAQPKVDNSSWMQPGMTAEQSLQYNQEVANARAINAQQQALRPTRPEGTVMNGLMERTPDQQRRDAEGSASSIHGSTAARGRKDLQRLTTEKDARLKAATQKYTSDNTLAGTAMEVGRRQQQDAWGMTKDVHGFQKDERTYQDGAPDRQTKALQAQQAVRTAQLYDAYQNATDPKQQAAIAERLRVLTGKDKPEAWKAVALSGGKDAMGNPQPGGALILNPTTGEHKYVQGDMGQLPPGMKKQVGTSNGKPVYEDAQGKRFVAS